MKLALALLLALFSLPAFASTPEIAIPERYIKLLKTVDSLEVIGTNDLGGAENFTIHNYKAITQFVHLLTDDRYIAVPKDLKPKFKSLSAYKIRLFAKDAPILELNIIADSIIDLPDDPSYYMEGERHSDILVAPLLRAR